MTEAVPEGPSLGKCCLLRSTRVILEHPSWAGIDRESCSLTPNPALQPQAKDRDLSLLSTAAQRSIIGQLRSPPAQLSNWGWGNGRGSGGRPQGPNPKTLQHIWAGGSALCRWCLSKEDAGSHLQWGLESSLEAKTQLTWGKIPSLPRFHSTANNFLPDRVAQYCKVLHPGKICHDRACFHSNKQDIESISGIPNTNQTDEDNTFLQTSKERETTQRPEYTNKVRGKKEY